MQHGRGNHSRRRPSLPHPGSRCAAGVRRPWRRGRGRGRCFRGACRLGLPNGKAAAAFKGFRLLGPGGLSRQGG
eukprot:9344896-Alexandrium_andersonii.AAC.1